MMLSPNSAPCPPATGTTKPRRPNRKGNLPVESVAHAPSSRGYAEIRFDVPYLLSNHARMRLCQRGLSIDDVSYILCNGICEQIAAANIYYLRDIDIPGDEQLLYQRLVGTAIIIAPDRELVITVWRNRKHGLRNLRRKRAKH